MRRFSLPGSLGVIVFRKESKLGLPIDRFVSLSKARQLPMMTTESVSVILSVENAQNYLASDLEGLMECLSEMTGRFEIIVIDNASRDYTIEILDDMRNRFPQIRYRRMNERIATEEAVDNGMAMAVGEYLFVSTSGTRIDANELRRLWALRVDPRLLVARSRTTARRVDASLINRLTNWAQRITSSPEPIVPTPEPLGGLQMMRRDALSQLQPKQAAGSPNIEISHISHQQLASPKLVESRRRVLN